MIELLENLAFIFSYLDTGGENFRAHFRSDPEVLDAAYPCQSVPDL